MISHRPSLRPTVHHIRPLSVRSRRSFRQLTPSFQMTVTPNESAPANCLEPCEVEVASGDGRSENGRRSRSLHLVELSRFAERARR